jgi:hypothetical protein
METLMSYVRIDPHKLRTAIADLASECTLIKRVLRARWERPMAEEQKRACRLRRNLTELHVLLAWARGRLHVTSPPEQMPHVQDWDARTHAARIAERLAPDYAPPVTMERTETTPTTPTTPEQVRP